MKKLIIFILFIISFSAHAEWKARLTDSTAIFYWGTDTFFIKMMGDSIILTGTDSIYIDKIMNKILYSDTSDFAWNANLWKGLDTTYFIRNVDTTVLIPGLGQFLDSLSNHLISINLKLNKSDTTGLSDRIDLKLNSADVRDTVIQVLTDLNYIDSTLLSDSLALKMNLSVFNDSANQFKTDSQLVTLSQMNDTNNTYGKWDTTGNDIYYDGGYIGGGTNNPVAPITAGDVASVFGGTSLAVNGQMEIKHISGTDLFFGLTSTYAAFGLVGAHRLALRTTNLERMSISPTGDVGIHITTPQDYFHTNISESGTTKKDYKGKFTSNENASDGNGIGDWYGLDKTDESISAGFAWEMASHTGASEIINGHLYTYDGSKKLTASYYNDSILWFNNEVKKMWLNSLGLHLADTLYLGATSSKLWNNNDTLTTNVFEADNYIRNDSTLDQIIDEQVTCGLSVWAKKSSDMDGNTLYVTITAYANLSGTTWQWTGGTVTDGSAKSTYAFDAVEYQLVGTNGSCTDTAFVTVNGNTVIQDWSGQSTSIPSGNLILDDTIVLATTVIISNSGDDCIIDADTTKNKGHFKSDSIIHAMDDIRSNILGGFYLNRTFSDYNGCTYASETDRSSGLSIGSNLVSLMTNSASRLIISNTTAAFNVPLTIDGYIYQNQAEYLATGVAGDHVVWSNAGTNVDTVEISGTTANTEYIITWASDPGSPGAKWFEAKTDTVIFHTENNVTGNPAYFWKRIELYEP